jgi:hypothetical protein
MNDRIITTSYFNKHPYILFNSTEINGQSYYCCGWKGVLYSENPLHVLNSSVCRMLKSSVVFGFEIKSSTRMDFELRICLSVVYLAAVFQ